MKTLKKIWCLVGVHSLKTLWMYVEIVPNTCSVQGPYLKIDQSPQMMKQVKSQNKMCKNKNDICYCPDVEGAVFRVQGL